MSRLALPSEVGFDPRQEAIDRCQVALLRELASQQGGRLVLKGGMAMRAAFGSTRLTKDIDFDRDPSLSQDTLKRTLEKSLTRAASVAGISSARVAFTKDSKTTVRARLQGLAGGTDVRFDVEVSGRPASKANIRTEVVAPPAKYAMAPFPVTTYTNEALAAMKIAAALSDMRNAPRDLYDLRDLVRAGTDPTQLLAQQDPATLCHFAARCDSKLEMLTHRLATQELLPYLAPAERAELTEEAWLDATVQVAGHIKTWCAQALALQAAQAPPAPRAPGEQRG